MTRDIDTPETVGELAELLGRYPKDAKLHVYVTSLGDYGSTSEDESLKVRIQDDWPDDTIFLTFAFGYTLP